MFWSEYELHTCEKFMFGANLLTQSSTSYLPTCYRLMQLFWIYFSDHDDSGIYLASDIDVTEASCLITATAPTPRKHEKPTAV